MLSSFRISKLQKFHPIKRLVFQQPLSRHFSLSNSNSIEKDLVLSTLNEWQDISVKVVNCRNLLQECITRQNLSDTSGQALGELISCGILLNSHIKGEETVQINMLGEKGVKNLIGIFTSDMKVKGKVSKGNFDLPDKFFQLNVEDILGQGQFQVIKNHPSWKAPMNGIVELRNTSIAMNFGLYAAESEQKISAFLTDVQVTNGVCSHALGLMVERLPNALDAHVDTAIDNIGKIQSKKMRSYLLNDLTIEDSMHEILNDCLFSMEKNSFRWINEPCFHCSCSIDKVKNVLKLLPKKEIESIINANEGVEVSIIILFYIYFKFFYFLFIIDEMRFLLQ